MQKAEFLKLLQDPEVCQAIAGIVKNGGKPLKAESDSGTFASLRDRFRHSFSLSSDEPASPPAKPAAKPVPPKAAAPEKPAPAPQRPEPAEKPQPAPEAAAPSLNIGGGLFGDKLKYLRSHVQQATAERAAHEKEESKAAAAAAPKEKYTFVLERPCPVCGESTRVVKCKARLNVESTDIDLCIHYKDANPYLYRVWACEHCGFAADEKKFLKPLPKKTQEQLQKFLAESNMALPFMEERTPEAALSYCEMAVLFSELSDPSYNRRANLYLIMAWIYRYEGDSAHERAALDKAAEFLDLSLESESYPVDSMSDTTASYLAGAVHTLRQDYDKAARHLSRLISDRNLQASAPNVYNKARDLWQDIKKARQ